MSTRPDAPVLLVGSYTEPDGQDGVLLCRREGDDLQVFDRLALRNASWLEELDDHLVLACSEHPESELVLLHRDGRSVGVVDRQPTGGADACHLAVSPGGRWVAVANYSSGSVTLFPTPVGGRLAPPAALLTFRGSGPVTERQQSPHAHHCAWLDDRHVLVCDLGADLVRVLRLDGSGAQTGRDQVRLTELEPIVLPAGSGPRHLLLRRSTRWLDLAVCSELSGEVFSVRHDHTGLPQGEGAPGDVDWSSGWRLLDRTGATRLPGAATPSGIRRWGDQLVVANRGTRSVALLDWNADGALRHVAEHPCGGTEPRDLVVQDDQLWVANQESGWAVVLERRGTGLAEVARHRVGRPARLLFTGRAVGCRSTN